jgi:hypothetical protein
MATAQSMCLAIDLVAIVTRDHKYTEKLSMKYLYMLTISL